MRRLPYILAGLGSLLLLAYWFISYRATHLITTLLRDFATAETARLSDSVYELHVGSLHINWARRLVALDSVVLSTNTERNARQPWPSPSVGVVLRNCTISGISVSRLVFDRGLSAGAFGCRDVAYFTESPTVVPAQRSARHAAPARSDTAGSAAAGAFLSLQKSLTLPSQVPRIGIRRIAFPNVAISLIQHYDLGKMLTFNLERAQLRAEGLLIDPGDPAAATRTLFSRSVTLSAKNALFRPDTATSASLAQLDVDLTDSILTIHGLSYGPDISEADFVRETRWRRDRIRARAESLTAKGMDIHLFARTGAARLRTLEVDGLHFEIRTDKRQAVRPGRGTPMRPIQRFIADRPRSWEIDTIRIRHSEVVYEEFAPNRDAPGRLVFAHLQAQGTSFRHERGRITTEHPFILETTAQLMGLGLLRVRFEVPFDAADFAMRVRGSLGPMPAAALNPLIAQIMPAAISGGEVQGINFAFRVANGRAAGDVTPLYTGFGLRVTGQGMTGIIACRGIIGGIARGAAGIAASGKVFGSNPAKPGGAPRVGMIRHTFDGESVPTFLWVTLRSGLLPVVMK